MYRERRERLEEEGGGGPDKPGLLDLGSLRGPVIDDCMCV